MRSASSGAELIERFLLARGRRYFRGHHDGEYFFILITSHERLHVHLETSPAETDTDTDTLTVRTTPAYFYPAADGERLRQLADEWNRQDRRVTAIVYESCDQSRIGVLAQDSYSLAPNVSFEEFAELADDTISSAVQLFAEITPAAPKSARTLGTWLKDAG